MSPGVGDPVIGIVYDSNDLHMNSSLSSKSYFTVKSDFLIYETQKPEREGKIRLQYIACMYEIVQNLKFKKWFLVFLACFLHYIIHIANKESVT